MRVYIPFDDGSSVSFDGENFTIHKRPKDIDAVDKPDIDIPSKAEKAWAGQWNDLVRALENAWRKQKDIKRASDTRKIYRP